jgi:hypothetical protein
MKLGRIQLTTASFPSHIARRDNINFQVPDFRIRVNVINKRKFAVQIVRQGDGRTDGPIQMSHSDLQHHSLCNTGYLPRNNGLCAVSR